MLYPEGPQGSGIVTIAAAKVSVQYVLVPLVVIIISAQFALQNVLCNCHDFSQALETPDGYIQLCNSCSLPCSVT